jgi:hypothetical protein
MACEGCARRRAALARRLGVLEHRQVYETGGLIVALAIGVLLLYGGKRDAE